MRSASTPSNISSWPSPAWLAAIALVVAFGAAAPAFALPLDGMLTDAMTGVPIAGADVQVLGTHQHTTTDAQGRWHFDLPKGDYELRIVAKYLGHVQTSRMVNQYVPHYRVSRAYVYTSAFAQAGYPVLKHPIGIPSESGQVPANSPETLDVTHLWNGVTHGAPNELTIPSTPPMTIRVGRRQNPTGGGCSQSTNPIVAIDEMSLDDYVKGVLPGEIGVFRSLSGVGEVYKAFAIAAKSYGLYFMLYYGANHRRTVPHPLPPHNDTWFNIDDSACNQRYVDQRLTQTTQAADAVAGKVLVKKGAPNQIDEYEYAASCGKHGTQPSYQTALVPDKPPKNACVGSWCGHDTCAGHADNPNVPGQNRCLVRGICQWGAASWGVSGKSYTWMLSHYQPNLQVRVLNPPPPATVKLTGYVYSDPNDIAGSGISGVAVSLNDGEHATTNAQGVYTFAQVRVSLGRVTITATKSGYQTNSRHKQLQNGATNWASLQLTPSGTANNPPDAGAVHDAVGQGSHDTGGNGGHGGTSGGAVDAAGTSGSQPADAAVAADAPTGSTSSKPKNPFGPLVGESQGTPGGCTEPASPVPGRVPAVLVVLAAMGVLWRGTRTSADPAS